MLETLNTNDFRLKDYQIKEEAIIASRQNIYSKISLCLNCHSKDLKKFTMINQNMKSQKKTPSINEEARLILALYKRKRYGAFMKVYNYLCRQVHKETPYDEIIAQSCGRNAY